MRLADLVLTRADVAWATEGKGLIATSNKLGYTVGQRFEGYGVCKALAKGKAKPKQKSAKAQAKAQQAISEGDALHKLVEHGNVPAVADWLEQIASDCVQEVFVSSNKLNILGFADGLCQLKASSGMAVYELKTSAWPDLEQFSHANEYAIANHAKQLAMYCLLIAEMYGLPTYEGYLLYLHQHTGELKVLHFAQADIAKWLQACYTILR